MFNPELPPNLGVPEVVPGGNTPGAGIDRLTKEGRLAAALGHCALLGTVELVLSPGIGDDAANPDTFSRVKGSADPDRLSSTDAPAAIIERGPDGRDHVVGFNF